MTHGNRLYILLAAALICGGVAVAEQVGLPKSATERSQPVALAGQQHQGLRVGEHVDPQDLHQIQRPALYGIGQSPAGSAYGVVQGQLIRFDPLSLQVLSIIRQVDRIRD